MIDLADARVLRGVLAGVPLDAAQLQDVAQALSEKDAPALAALTRDAPAETRVARCRRCCGLYGGDEVLDAARRALPARPLVRAGAGRAAVAGRATCGRPIPGCASASTCPT